MTDTLNLCDINKPMLDRYDDFVRWISSRNNNVPELLAEELGVDSSIIDVFFELGNLDDEEFIEIDKNKIDIGALFVFIRSKKELRMKVYENAGILLASSQPLRAIREFIDSKKVDLDLLVNSFSNAGLKSIAQYLKFRNIEEATLNKGFRSMLFNAGKMITNDRSVSEKMIDWILQGITYDNEKQLGVFSNDDFKSKYSDDYNIVQSILENINVETT